MLRCPKCASQQIHCSPTKSKWDAWRKRLTGKRRHRCEACGWRGWGEETGPNFSAEEIEVASRAIAQPLDRDVVLITLEPPPETRLSSFSTERPAEAADADAMSERSDSHSASVSSKS